MKAFTNLNPKSLDEAMGQLKQAAQKGQSAAIAGGGSDLLGMVKERLVTPDVLVHLRSIRGMDQVTEERGQVKIGGLITLDALSQHPLIHGKYAVLSEAAAQVGTPQIRNAGTQAVVSVAMALEMNGGVCRSARVVLGGVAPIPWRLPKVEAMLTGQRVTPELAARAGEAALEGAQPLAKNGYKIPLTKAVVKRTALALGASA